jgi:hypothetical protein
MSVLAVYKDVLASADEIVTDTIDFEIGDNMRLAITPPMLQEIILTSKIRSLKVIAVRRQLAQGTYDLDERLDAILERLLMDITR